MNDRFRSRLDRHAESAGSPAPDTRALIRAGRRKRAVRGAGIVVAATVAIAGLAIPLAALRDLDHPDTTPAATSTPSETESPTPTPSPPLRLQGTGTVLQAKGDDVAGLCLGVVLTSFPPQCGGIPLIGWNWGAVEGEGRASGTIWGSFHVIGTYDEKTFTVEEVLPPETSSNDNTDFTAPCPEPPGGWVDVDPSKASEADFHAAARSAEGEPDSTATWIDYIADHPPSEHPGPFIAVFGFTGDLERHERALRELWGGPMCVFVQAHSHADLRRIQNDLSDGGAQAVGLELLWSSVNVTTNQVEVGAVLTTPEIEQALAERYGVGTVRVVPALTPA